MCLRKLVKHSALARKKLRRTIIYTGRKPTKKGRRMSKTLLTKKQVAERLGSHPNTVDNYVKNGWITPRRLSPRKLLYVWEEIEQHLDLS